MLTGKKTYIIGIAGILYAILGFFLGHLDGKTAIEAIQISLVAMGLRSAIS